MFATSIRSASKSNFLSAHDATGFSPSYSATSSFTSAPTFPASPFSGVTSTASDSVSAPFSTGRTSSSTSSLPQYDRDLAASPHPSTSAGAIVPRSVPAVPAFEPPASPSTQARYIQAPPSTSASVSSSTMSSFYPADFAHSAPGSTSGSGSGALGASYPPRAGLEGSRPYTMAGYLGTSTSAGAGSGSGVAPPASSAGHPSTTTSSSYHGDYSSTTYQPATGTAAGGSSTTAGMLTGYRPASSHETLSGANYSYPSARSSFSTYASLQVASAYGFNAVGPSTSTTTPYHHGAYAHPAYGPAPVGSTAAGAMPQEYAAYPAHSAPLGSDPSTTYNSGVPAYAHPGSTAYTYGGQAGLYPGSQYGSTSMGVASGPYGVAHVPGQAVHYLNPFEVKHRRRTTKQQFRVLEGTFKENPKPNAAVRKALAQQLDMPGRAVQIWFQNRRAKAKAQAKKEEQASRERGAMAEGSTSSSASKSQHTQADAAAHTRSATAPQPSSTNSSTDSYAGRASPLQGDYRHAQLPPPPGAYGQPSDPMHGHHLAPHHGSSGQAGWHSSHQTGPRN